MNVAGGVRIDEPGADLAVALAIVSAAKGVAGPSRDSPRSARSASPVGCGPRPRRSGGWRSARSSGSSARRRTRQRHRGRGKIRILEAETLRQAMQGRARCRATEDATALSTADARLHAHAVRGDPRRDPKLLAAIARIAPGTELRQGIDDIIRSHEGALIVIGEPAELSFLFSGGIRLDQPFTPAAPVRAGEDGRGDHRQRRRSRSSPTRTSS